MQSKDDPVAKIFCWTLFDYSNKEPSQYKTAGKTFIFSRYFMFLMSDSERMNEGSFAQYLFCTCT